MCAVFEGRMVGNMKAPEDSNRLGSVAGSLGD
jgi:hypothetical protein